MQGDIAWSSPVINVWLNNGDTQMLLQSASPLRIDLRDSSRDVWASNSQTSNFARFPVGQSCILSFHFLQLTHWSLASHGNILEIYKYLKRHSPLPKHILFIGISQWNYWRLLLIIIRLKQLVIQGHKEAKIEISIFLILMCFVCDSQRVCLLCNVCLSMSYNGYVMLVGCLCIWNRSD